MKKVIAIIIFLFVLLFIFINNNVTFVPHSYDRTIYSIVIHNNSKLAFDDISVLYGRDINDKKTLFEFCNIDNLYPEEYRKININTTTPSKQAQVPYNVFVRIKYGEDTIYSSAGYFAIDKGGLSCLEIKVENNKPVLQRLYAHERKYKRILKRHYKKQFEYSW